eukprot:TRINITY_DN11027_c0_g1_i3.p1 TRINITY_DN11027_c0_g1~~TRINITY_DN11027_c0_g1_i3.p1  ORF type:complete len:326 (-),score=65.43 TRINITY_DN11027_c0_g1_i3:65-1042(-)
MIIGDTVEVCRREDGSFYWLKAKVLSIHGLSCEVKYENLSDNDGEPISEVVSSELVRPVPPVMQGSRKAKVGEWIEVYENHAWRRGKIIAVLPMRYFMIRLFGSVQENRYHLLNLRRCLSWEDYCWVSASQPSRNDYSVESTIDLKGRLAFPSDGASQIGSRKRKATHMDGEHLKNSLASWFPTVVSKRLHRGSIGVKSLDAPLLKDGSSGSSEDGGNRTSVASCSGKCVHEGNLYTTLNNLLDDAQSTKLCEPGMDTSPLNKKEVATKLHELQIQAYQSLLRAFYASGNLTWDREILLTDLRKLLDISTDEHLSQLRELLALTL